jgi:site-specific DNA-methyltransferase (adenine-specific)
MMNLMQGDCLELMKTIPDGSVDMVLTDPPYQLTNWTNPMQWDKVLDLTEVWHEIKRITKPTSAVCLFGNEPYSTTQRNSNPTMFKYDVIWVKNKVTGPMNAKVKPLKSYEVISVFSTGKTSPGRDGNMKYYPQGLKRVDKEVKNTKSSRSVMSDRPSIKPKYVQEFTNYPKDLVYFDCESGLHPTQKPVALMEYLIKTYTNYGETVLDFTMGSGSTGVAAKNLNRDFIGIELDENYYNIAKERING